MANQPLKKTTIITNPDQDDNRPLTVEEQRARLRQLIIQGKERGYMMHSLMKCLMLIRLIISFL